MKTILTLALLALTPLAHAHGDKHKVAGPNGGRVVATVEPHFEFLVTPERKIKLTFLTDDNKLTAPSQQSVTAIGGDRVAPTRFNFTRESDVLVSDKPLPEGNEIPIVLQIKVTPNAKTVTTRFTINLAQCPTCEHAEYACTCEH
ncbi:MAG: hypothetical protein QM627_08895 [Luteolibacter sp.]